MFLEPETYTSFTSHDNKEFEAELVVNPEVLKTVKEGDLMALYSTPDPRDNREVPREHRLILRATLSKRSLLNYPFSIHKSVKEAFDLSDTVTMGQANPRDVQADHVELTIKGQFIPRGDLYRFLNYVDGQTAWGGKVFDVPGLLRARVNHVRRGKRPVYAGIISKQTHVSCRSRSSRIFWLVQLSPEMYDYNQWGDLYYEVFLRFVEEVLEKWKDLEVAHSLTVVFFCRTYFRGNKRTEPFLPKRGLYARPIMTAPDGKQYEDTYKVVVSNETMAQSSHDLLWRLEDALNEFPKTMQWFKKVDLNAPTNATVTLGKWSRDETGTARRGVGGICGGGDGSGVAGDLELDLTDSDVRLCVPAYASMGNILEAFNVTLNVLQKHYLDRDLHRSGNSVVMITAGTGVFNVDGRLSATTTQRMMDNGIGMDMVSLSRPPLHTAPLFISKRRVPIEMAPATSHEAAAAAAARAKEHEQLFPGQHGVDSPLAGAGAGGGGSRRMSINSEETILREQPKYEVPHWMNLTFAAGSRPQSGPPKGTPAGLASTAPPEPTHAGVNKPTSMPRMVWPAQVSFHPDGNLDMDMLYMSRTLRVIVGLEKADNDLSPPPVAGGTGAREAEGECDERGGDSKRESVELVEASVSGVRPWHIVEEMYPQPPHGIEGAAEFARRLAETRAPPSPTGLPLQLPLSLPPSTVDVPVATPPFTPGGRRLKSPTGSYASSTGRFTSDTLGTSPSVGYAGSPRSLGRSTLSQVARPWPDRDNFVGATAQPTLRSSPRGYDPAGKGSGNIGVGEESGSTPVGGEVSKSGPRWSTGGAEVFRVYSDKKINEEEFQLWVPKFKEYDGQVDKLLMDDTPPQSGSSSRTVMKGDWGSLPVEETPIPISRSSSSGPFPGADLLNSRMPFHPGEEPLHRGVITIPLNSPSGRRASVSGIEVGGGHSSDGGSSSASSPMPRDSVIENQISVASRGRVGGGTSEGGKEHDESPTPATRGVAVAASRSPVNTRSWGWGRRQDLAQPGSSPGNTLWPPLKESNPKVDAKCAAIVERESGGTGSSDASGEGGSSSRGSRNESRGGSGVLKSLGGSRSPPQSRVSPTTASLSGTSRDPTVDGPSLSPLETSVVGGSDSPPARSIAVRSADRPIPQAPVHPTRGSRSLPWQAQDSPKARGEVGGQQGARMPPIGSQPVKIERTSSDSSGGGLSRSTSGRRGARKTLSSAPREVPRKIAGHHASAATAAVTAGTSAHGYGQGQGRGQSRMMTGLGWSRSGSNQDSPTSAGSAKLLQPGLKTDTQVRPRRQRMRPSHDMGGSAPGMLPTGQGPDISGSAEREIFGRGGRYHPSAGSVGSINGVSGVGSSSAKRESGGGGRTRAATITSEPGSGAQRSAGRSRVVEVDFNPFKRQDEKELLKSRTHNRRRWTHVFAPGEKEFQTIDTMPGPIWVSLSQPALLPLSIDFLPSRNEILEDYLESNYDVDLGDHHTLDSVKPLLEEMVAQRVAQDFQIVEKIGFGPGSSEAANAYGSLASRGRDQKSRKGGANEDGLVHILSMGHRIQTLYYDKSSKILKVRSFTHKAGRGTSNAGYDYCYSLWLPVAGHVQTIQQKFHKYPEPEYPFTYMDNLISGDITELTEGTKFRRLLFNIVPPEVNSAKDEEAFIEAMKKLAGYLNKRKQDSPEIFPVAFTFVRRFGELSQPGQDEVAVVEEPMSSRRRSVRIEMTSQSPPGPSLPHISSPCSFSVEVRDEDEKQEANGGAKPYNEWLDVSYDELVDVKRVVRLDVRWLLCSAAKVFEYVKELANCAAEFNIFLQQVPEYARTRAINQHPLMTHPFIRVPEHSAGDDRHVPVLSFVQKYMVRTMDFIRCSDVHTDWESFGLTEKSEMAELGEDIAGKPRERSEDPPGRVYFHRSGAAFVRVAPGGLVLFENVHLRDPTGVIAQEWEVEDLPRALLETLQQLVTVVHLAQSVVNGAISEAVDASWPGNDSGSGSRSPVYE